MSFVELVGCAQLGALSCAQWSWISSVLVEFG